MSEQRDKAAPSEPKHEHGWHYGYITCSCGWAWDSRNALTGSLATQHGLRMFEKHKAEPQPICTPNPLVHGAILNDICKNASSLQQLYFELATEINQWREWAGKAAK